LTAVDELERAEPLYRESLAMLRKVYGEEHPEVAQTMGNLADFLAYDKGPSPRGSRADLEEAETLHRQALEMNRRIRPDHPYLGDNLSALAQLRHLAGDEVEAERLVREALRVYRLKLSEEHTKTVAAKRKLAEILMARRRAPEAEPLLIECYRALSTGRPEGARELEAVRRDLVELYGLLGKPALAAKYRTPPERAGAAE
jgi:hypothetical protein